MAKIGIGATTTSTTSPSAITSVASMTKNVSAIALNTKIESAKPLYSVGVLTRLESGWRHGSIN